MNIKEALEYGRKELNKYKIEEINLKLKILLSKLLNVSKEYLIIHDEGELQVNIEKSFKEGIKRIVDGEPIQYIVNHQEFFGLDFYVDKNVLIPQPDTEILVQNALEKLNHINNPNVLDLCTGSGIIAVSVAKNVDNSVVTASDISENALEIAKNNADNNNVKIEFIESNLFENINKKFDMIISNPPYIETEVIEDLSNEVKNEPIIALDGGEDGLYFYRKIAENSRNYLNENGYLLLEIGYNQKKEVIKLLEKENFKNIEGIKDFGNNDRVIIANV